MVAKEIADIIIEAFKRGKRVYIIGNGGSATMAEHFAGELWQFPVIALTNLATITAIANDLGYGYVFSKQIKGLGKKGDILITLSTSGTSDNILEAIVTAESLGLTVIEFPSNAEIAMGYTERTQEKHLKLIHRVVREIDDSL